MFSRKTASEVTKLLYTCKQGMQPRYRPNACKLMPIDLLVQLEIGMSECVI